MRCKKHLSDYSSSIGVCATCLRQRLAFLAEAQSIPNSVSDNPNPNNHSTSSHHHRHQEQPPPLIFPRSVSPYISRRKSDQTESKPVIQRFYSTPQVGPTFSEKKKNSGGKKFSLISKLFRSKSSVTSSTSAANSEAAVGPNRRCNRGMSPQSEWEDADPIEWTRPSPGRVKQSPARLANNVASLALCLSPLVRASPASRHHLGVEPTFSGEIRVPASGKINSSNCHIIHSNSNKKSEKPYLGEAASFCANRSRKIADFGRRLNRNR